MIELTEVGAAAEDADTEMEERVWAPGMALNADECGIGAGTSTDLSSSELGGERRWLLPFNVGVEFISDTFVHVFNIADGDMSGIPNESIFNSSCWLRCRCCCRCWAW